MELIKGYLCSTYADAANAQRNVDPAHPEDGPFRANAPQAKAHGEAVVFGGALANLDSGSSGRDATRESKIKGGELDVST